jgi:hypothetical protein
VGAALSCTAFLKFGRLYDPRLVAGTDGEGRTLYDRKSMITLEREIPVVIDHDLDQRIGVVRWLDELPDTDGDWYAALTEITHPPPWLKRGTRVSFSSRPFQRSEYNGWQLVQRAILEEISVLSAELRPVEPCAQVMTFRADNAATGAAPARHTTGDQVIYHHGERLVRHGCGQVLGVR